MSEPNSYDGYLLKYDDPVWSPLVTLVGDQLAGPFMWMGAILLEDGREVHAYKHHSTRRYLHIALDGTAFAYDRGRYEVIALTEAIEEAFDGWDVFTPAPDDVRATCRELNRVLTAAAAVDAAN